MLGEFTKLFIHRRKVINIFGSSSTANRQPGSHQLLMYVCVAVRSP